MEIVASHDSFNNKHSIKVEENFPFIHWLPRVYKNLYKFIYIVHSRTWSTKNVSFSMTLVLQSINIHVSVYEESGVNLFWFIHNSLEVINSIKS